MKKSHAGKKTKKQSLIKGVEFNPLVAFLVMLITVLVGGYIVYQSFATAGHPGTFTIHAPEGTTVTVNAEGFPVQDFRNCNPHTVTANGFGIAYFYSCWSSDNYTCKQYSVASATKPGYAYWFTAVDGQVDNNWPVCADKASPENISIAMKTAPAPPPPPPPPAPTTPPPSNPPTAPPPAPSSHPPTPPPSTSNPSPQPTSGSGSTSSTNKSSSTAKTTTPHPPPRPAPAIVVASGGDTSPPTQPQNFLIEISSEGAALSWSVSTDNIGVVGYLVERSTDQEQWQSIAQNLSDTSFTDQGLDTSTVYYYRVRALDAAGNQSEAAVADIEVPDPAEANSQASQAQKKHSSHATGIITGISIILLGFGGWLWWLRRKHGALDKTYGPSHQVLENATADAAPHTSQSLKELVMEDLHSKHPPEHK